MHSPARWRAGLIAQRLKEGAVIAYPTEGVWGLGCIPDSMHAVARILGLKQRSWRQGLILVAGTMAEVEPYLEGISAAQRRTLEAAWPGPVTFLVPDNGTAPEWIRGGHQTVALRVSQHPVIAALCAGLGGPIVSTSANPGGRPPATSELRLRQYFPDNIDFIVPGRLGGTGSVSRIIELESGIVHRAGRQTR